MVRLEFVRSAGGAVLDVKEPIASLADLPSVANVEESLRFDCEQDIVDALVLKAIKTILKIILPPVNVSDFVVNVVDFVEDGVDVVQYVLREVLQVLKLLLQLI